MGPKGCIINAVRNDSGARMMLSDEGQVDAGCRLLTITGSPAQVAAARANVFLFCGWEAVAREVKTGAQMPPPQPIKSIQYPATLSAATAACVMGKQGQGISKLQADSCARIDIDRRTNTVTISAASDDAATRALRLLDEVIHGAHKQRVAYDENPAPPEAQIAPASSSLEMWVRSSALPLILGSRRATLASVRRASGAEVDIPRSGEVPRGGQFAVRIRGALGEIVRARAHIDLLLSAAEERCVHEETVYGVPVPARRRDDAGGVEDVVYRLDSLSHSFRPRALAYVVGKGGVTATSIEAETGATLVIDKARQVVHIIGAGEERRRAFRAVDDLIRDLDPNVRARSEPRADYYVAVCQSDGGGLLVDDFFIGDRGSTARAVGSKTGARVEAVSGIGCEIIGSWQEVDQALAWYAQDFKRLPEGDFTRQRLMHILRSADEVVFGGRKAAPAGAGAAASSAAAAVPSDQRRVTAVCKVPWGDPNHLVGKMLGTRGIIVNQVQDDTGVRVDVRLDANRERSVVEIAGTRSQISAALALYRDQASEFPAVQHSLLAMYRAAEDGLRSGGDDGAAGNYSAAAGGRSRQERGSERRRPRSPERRRSRSPERRRPRSLSPDARTRGTYLYTARDTYAEASYGESPPPRFPAGMRTTAAAQQLAQRLPDVWRNADAQSVVAYVVDGTVERERLGYLMRCNPLLHNGQVIFTFPGDILVYPPGDYDCAHKADALKYRDLFESFKGLWAETMVSRH